MAPKDDPKLIVYVAVQQPDLDGTGLGALPVSAIFNPVMKNSLQYLNIQPSKSQKAQLNKLSDFIEKSVEATEKELKAKDIETVVIGKGTKVVRQLPESGTTVLEGEKVIIQTNGDKLAPDMTGWSLRDVMKVANIAGLKLNSKGQGYVTQQNIKPKTIMRNGDFLIVDLKTPEEQWTQENQANSNGQDQSEENIEEIVQD
jgi:penicillin-binding protein 2B